MIARVTATPAAIHDTNPSNQMQPATKAMIAMMKAVRAVLLTDFGGWGAAGGSTVVTARTIGSVAVESGDVNLQHA